MRDIPAGYPADVLQINHGFCSPMRLYGGKEDISIDIYRYEIDVKFSHNMYLEEVVDLFTQRKLE